MGEQTPSRNHRQRAALYETIKLEADLKEVLSLSLMHPMLRFEARMRARREKQREKEEMEREERKEEERKEDFGRMGEEAEAGTRGSDGEDSRPLKEKVGFGG